ncbi:hypothetical protein FEM03_11850 [Phragmitibacter flavus]|uniref:Uncharacterized protein n=1 Tax=Phragmitibacter flavus TaxID=2576071 RepID=A0A5R8KFP8_9BACT|nr:hypothetical protein [Phragmitibacter flavus]TLD70419.1 hypothetical protein FEM03_11850 [Phragmitibacter flavus]
MTTTTVSTTTFNIADISPWPPTLNFTPEVESGVSAAAALAFGPNWDTPMNELTSEQIMQDMLRLSPDIAEDMFAIAFGLPV